MSARERPLYRFAEFELEPGERRLWRGGVSIALTPKAFELLALLVEQPGHVISKDELLAVLWPGRIVLESNLTKHIWQLRRALGVDEHDASLIETVPKLGYRFAAPVTREAREPGAPAATASRPVLSRPMKWAALAVAGVAAIGAAGWLAQAGLRRDFGSGAPASAAVAVIGLNNLSQRAEDAWIGTALTEMLSTDLALGGRVHALPDELVRPARSGIAAPAAGGFGRASLTTLRRRLDADYVISGAYLVSNAQGAALVRMDFIIQDARTGATLATLSRSGAVTDLPGLATLAGAELRGDVEGRRAMAEVPSAPAPPTADVMRRMGTGLEALRNYDAASARDAFLQAVAEAPAYAPAYADLARAWSALGYKSRALAAADQAAAHDADLPLILRLQIDVQKLEAQFDWPKAVAALRQVSALQPGDPEPRLQLISALLSAGKAREAQAVFEQLRALPGRVSDDARVELAAASIAGAREDPAAVVAHATRALSLARQREAGALAAEAETQIGIARGVADPRGAEAMLRQALADYTRAGNPHGQAWALQNLGNQLSGRDPARARQAYESSLAIYQRIGDEGGVAADYSDLAIMLWTAGDRDGAETAVRDVLEIRRRTEDLTGQAWALTALAIQQSDEAASDEAIANFRRAIALDEAAEARGHLGFTLFSLSDDLRQRGALAEAARGCALAQKAYQGLPDRASGDQADFECAQIALDVGDLPAAQSGLAHARAEAVTEADQMGVANSDLTLGQIAMGQRRWAAAAGLIGQASGEYARADLVTGRAVAASLLALCDDALGKYGERDRQAALARELRDRVTERQEVFQLDIALAQLRGQSGARDSALASLHELALEAQKRRWLGWSMEARLAAAEVAGRDPRHIRERDALLAAARKAGYGWVVKRLS